MRKIRIGATSYLSARPLIFGLTREPRSDVHLIYAQPGALSDALERGDVDAALIPSIEFLRGVGQEFIRSAALVATGKSGSLLLVTDRAIDEVERIAVDENCRTPLAALRIVLDQKFGILPDMCVHKTSPVGWRDGYDAVLLTGDAGLERTYHPAQGGDTCYDLGELWYELHACPLVISVWAFNDESLRQPLDDILGASRDFGVKNMSLLADGLSKTTAFDNAFLRRYFTTGWSYSFGAAEEQGLKALEQHALSYQLIRGQRVERAGAG